MRNGRKETVMTLLGFWWRNKAQRQSEDVFDGEIRSGQVRRETNSRKEAENKDVMGVLMVKYGRNTSGDKSE